jgi:hypothetical protein
MHSRRALSPPEARHTTSNGGEEGSHGSHQAVDLDIQVVGAHLLRQLAGAVARLPAAVLQGGRRVGMRTGRSGGKGDMWQAGNQGGRRAGRQAG